MTSFGKARNWVPLADSRFSATYNPTGPGGQRCGQVVGYVPFENFIGRAEFLFFSTDGSAELW